MKKRKMMLMLLIVTGIAVLSACSSGGGSSSGNEEGTQRKESSASLSQFASENGEMWDDSWSTDTASGASMGIRTNALIEVPELKQMSTVEVQRYTFDEGNKKKMAEAVFDEVYYHDEEHLMDYEIQELINNCQECLRDQESALQNLKEKENKEKTDEKDIQVLEEGIKEDREQMKKYEKLLKEAPKDYVKVEGDAYKGKQFTGKRNGIQYLLEFDEFEDDIYVTVTDCSEIYFRVRDMKDIYPDGITGDYMYYAEDIKLESENKSKITKEEAVKTAREFLQKAGFPDLILRGEEVLKWKDSIREDAPTVIDGWQFAFSPGTEDVSFADYVDFYDYSGGIITSETEVISDGRFSPNCWIIVGITDKGVINVDIRNPIIVLSSTPGVKLLPLDDIKTIIKNEIGGFIGFIQEKKKISNITFNRLTLGYYRVSDPEHKDQYTYVPAWKLWNNSGSNLSFVVNAMDGSVIEDWAERRTVVSKEEWDKMVAEGIGNE